MRLSILLTICFFNFAYCQSPAGIWYFGQKAGLSFNSGPIPISLNDGQLETYEGCSTLCDVSGNLLFYTDGVKVWNRNHVRMPNGVDLKGSPSSTQSAIIVPKPGSNTLYYVFTVDYLGNINGLNYSIVDMTLDGGLGDVTSKNTLLIAPTLEKITVVKHANNINYWVISHTYNSNQFVAYELTPTGIKPPVASNVGTPILNSTETVGYLKASPDGKLIACANSENSSSIQLYRFNNSTGQLSLISTSAFSVNPIGAYGIEFSPNGKLLYVSRIDTNNNSSQIYQFNIESLNETIINNSRTLIATFTNPARNGIFGALQLAPNQKIYVARNNVPYLGVINNPNTLGLGCLFQIDAVNLGANKSYYGLPAFVTSLFNINFTSENYCLGSSTSFHTPNYDAILSSSWDFGDPASPNNTSIEQNPTHVFTATGTYTVTLTVQTATGTNTFSDQVEIINTPVANQPTDYTLCEVNNGTAVFNLPSKNNEVLGSQLPADHTISYHLNLNDADDNINPLPASYTNITNPQIVYARIQPANGGECYDVTSFQLKTNPKPLLGVDKEVFYCLNTSPDLITLSAENSNPNDVLTFLWNNGETGETIQVNQAGTYTVTATNSYSCKSTRTIKVTNSEIAKIEYTIEGNIGNYSLIVNAIGTGNYMYAIDEINGNYQSSPVFNNLAPGNHILYVKDSNGCGLASENFYIIGYPKFFTPNGDGRNDTWSLSGNFKGFKFLSIFDRYGKLLKILTPNFAEWDGTYIGEKLPSTDYWFKVTLINDTIENGHFSLKR